MANVAELFLGTQGWSYADWVGPFYPPGTRPADYLRLYSQALRTVELDTTFYGSPRPQMVDGWRSNSPPGFVFAAKLPQTITHEKRLLDTERELGDFLAAISRLDDRLGPLLVQLPPDFRWGQDELAAVRAFLARLPGDFDFAVEFRHRGWARDEVFDLLRQHGVAWCVNDLYYLPKTVTVTADFSYLRWLGDRRRIERFGQLQIDRAETTDRWAATLHELSAQVTRIYGYYNNHYAGHAPGSVRMLQRSMGLPESLPPARGLFDL